MLLFDFYFYKLEFQFRIYTKTILKERKVFFSEYPHFLIYIAYLSAQNALINLSAYNKYVRPFRIPCDTKTKTCALSEYPLLIRTGHLDTDMDQKGGPMVCCWIWWVKAKKSVTNPVVVAGRGASLLFIIYFGAKFTSLRLSTEPTASANIFYDSPRSPRRRPATPSAVIQLRRWSAKKN